MRIMYQRSQVRLPFLHRNSRMFSGLLLVLSLVLSAAICEFGTRLFFGKPLEERLPLVEVRANRLRGWEMVPDTNHYTYTHEVRVNSLGLRGDELAPKDPGNPRILALGDSLVYGQGVPGELTIPFLMEKELAALGYGKRPDVINGGVRAYSTNQQLALLKEIGPVVDPDVVVLFWYWNDVTDEVDIPKTFRTLSEQGPIAFDLGDKAQGWPLLKWRLRQVLRGSAALMLAHDLVVGYATPESDNGMIEERIAHQDSYLEEFADLARRQGFRFVMATIPDVNSLLHMSRTERITSAVEELARKRGIRVVSLLESVREVYRSKSQLPLLPYDGHYDGDANTAMARTVAEAIVEMDAWPRRAAPGVNRE